MHSLALTLISDGPSYAKRLALAFEDDPKLRQLGFRELIRTQALVENYTSEDVSWSANDVDQATLDLSWYMALHRYELETEGVPN